MRTLVPGSYSRRQRNGRGLSRGFTLVEVLIVLLIAGILASVTLPTLSFRHVSSKDEAERLARLIEHAQVMATSLGSPIGLEISASQYEFLRWSGVWSSMDPGNLLGRHRLPADIVIESQPDPDSGHAAPRIIRFPPAGYPPAFGIRVMGAGHAWLVSGNLAGRVLVENKDSSP